MERITTISRNATNKITTMFKSKDNSILDDTDNEFDYNEYKKNDEHISDITYDYKNMDYDNSFNKYESNRIRRKEKIQKRKQRQEQIKKARLEYGQEYVQVQKKVRPVRTDENMMYVEKSEINAISEDVIILSQIAKDMGTLLEVQGEQLDIVHENVESSNITIQNAGAEVNEAIRRSRNSKYKKGVLATTGCTAAGAGIGFLGGPIGSVIGAGIGAGVGIVGSTIIGILT